MSEDATLDELAACMVRIKNFYDEIETEFAPETINAATQLMAIQEDFDALERMN